MYESPFINNQENEKEKQQEDIFFTHLLQTSGNLAVS